MKSICFYIVYHRSLLDYGNEQSFLSSRTYFQFLSFICDSLPLYNLAFTLSMFEGTTAHKLHNIVLCTDVCIKKVLLIKEEACTQTPHLANTLSFIQSKGLPSKGG